MVAAGLRIIILNMTKQDNHQIERVIALLKFALSLEDEEIVKSTVESVVEILEEIIK